MNIYNYNVNSLFTYEQDLDNIHSLKFGKWNKISALTDVYCSVDKKIGEINSLLGDSQTSVIGYVVFQFEHTFGLGEKSYLIPWNKFNVQATKNVFFIPDNISVLRNAPCFHQNQWPDDSEVYVEIVDEYWRNN